MFCRLFAAASALALFLAPESSNAGSLTLSSTFQLMVDAGVSTSDNSLPVPSPFDQPHGYDPAPVAAAPGYTSGAMTLNLASGEPPQFDFTFSLLSDAHPYVAAGSYGPSAIPVTLEIDQIEFTATGTLTSFGPNFFPEVSGSATSRGRLTVGASVFPFTISGPSGWSGDGAPAGAIVGSVAPNQVVLGYQYGEIWSFAGAGSADVASLDGVTFNVRSGIAFWSLTYVPEPGSSALLALGATLAVLVVRRPAARSGAAAPPCAARGRGSA